MVKDASCKQTPLFFDATILRRHDEKEQTHNDDDVEEEKRKDCEHIAHTADFCFGHITMIPWTYTAFHSGLGNFG